MANKKKNFHQYFTCGTGEDARSCVFDISNYKHMSNALGTRNRMTLRGSKRYKKSLPIVCAENNRLLNEIDQTITSKLILHYVTVINNYSEKGIPIVEIFVNDITVNMFTEDVVREFLRYYDEDRDFVYKVETDKAVKEGRLTYDPATTFDRAACVVVHATCSILRLAFPLYEHFSEFCYTIDMTDFTMQIVSKIVEKIIPQYTNINLNGKLIKIIRIVLDNHINGNQITWAKHLMTGKSRTTTSEINILYRRLLFSVLLRGNTDDNIITYITVVIRENVQNISMKRHESSFVEVNRTKTVEEEDPHSILVESFNTITGYKNETELYLRQMGMDDVQRFSEHLGVPFPFDEIVYYTDQSVNKGMDCFLLEIQTTLIIMFAEEAFANKSNIINMQREHYIALGTVIKKLMQMANMPLLATILSGNTSTHRFSRYKGKYFNTTMAGLLESDSIIAANYKYVKSNVYKYAQFLFEDTVTNAQNPVYSLVERLVNISIIPNEPNIENSVEPIRFDTDNFVQIVSEVLTAIILVNGG